VGCRGSGDAELGRTPALGDRRKEFVMGTFNRGYRLKAVAFLLVIGAMAAALFLGPALRRDPELEPPVNLPAMSNIPPKGSLSIETE
jgi:hypothetical protein